MVGYSYFMLNVSGDSNLIENRQVICNFIIYLHNADGLTDEQNIYLRAGMEINLTREYLNFEKNLSIVARTSLLVRTIQFYFLFMIKCSVPFSFFISRSLNLPIYTLSILCQ